jgi:hypothetical protein
MLNRLTHDNVYHQYHLQSQYYTNMYHVVSDRTTRSTVYLHRGLVCCDTV